ncbi:MAG: NAD+ synthase [Promethearchaeota archaeon]|nr:MAG: NAD+ synthase [Candidatus Lokiarchaeota archaeon]
MRKLDYKQTISEIQKWIKNYVVFAKVNGVVVGISGGIDSAVTTSLCVTALGKDNVIGLGLPISSLPQDLKDAEKLAKNLGIKFIKIELTSVYKEFINTTSSLFESNRIALANLKPRLRMMAIYFVGQSIGKFLVAGTSNRTELAIGYFTKYGDGGVDFEPIGGLYKCEVREIAKILDVSEEIIKKPPSAGLWEDQTDEGEIGLKYDVLDEIIFRIDNQLELNNLNKDNVKKVKNMMKKAQHKLTMPPYFRINIS